MVHAGGHFYERWTVIKELMRFCGFLPPNSLMWTCSQVISLVLFSALYLFSLLVAIKADNTITSLEDSFRAPAVADMHLTAKMERVTFIQGVCNRSTSQ